MYCISFESNGVPMYLKVGGGFTESKNDINRATFRTEREANKVLKQFGHLQQLNFDLRIVPLD